MIPIRGTFRATAFAMLYGLIKAPTDSSPILMIVMALILGISAFVGWEK